jgi:hypothetical protein
MTMQIIHAVTSKPIFDIQAALAHPAVKMNARILAQIGIEKPTARIPLRVLEEKMAAAGLEPQKRIELKLCLERSGLLIEA